MQTQTWPVAGSAEPSPLSQKSAVGDDVGLAVADPVGLAVGEAVGDAVGVAVGLAVGDAVGEAVGVSGCGAANSVFTLEVQLLPQKSRGTTGSVHGDLSALPQLSLESKPYAAFPHCVPLLRGHLRESVLSPLHVIHMQAKFQLSKNICRSSL